MGEGLFQPLHLLVIAFIALLVFGPKRLPELGKGIGDGIRALKNGLREAEKPQQTESKSPNEERSLPSSGPETKRPS